MDASQSRRLQEDISAHPHNDTLHSLHRLTSSSPLHRAHLAAAATTTASAPFYTLPLSSNDLYIDAEVWRTMFDARLGNPLFDGSRLCPTCATGSSQDPPVLDPPGHHATVCKGGVGAVRRHNRLRDTLYRHLTNPAIALSVSRERALAADLHKSPAEQRALDVVIDDPQGIDVTIVNPRSHPFRNLADGGVSAVERATRKKHDYYGPPCRSEGIELRPLAIDIYGRIDISGPQLLQDIANFIASRRGKSPFHEFGTLRTTISAFVLRYTADIMKQRRIRVLSPH